MKRKSLNGHWHIVLIKAMFYRPQRRPFRRHIFTGKSGYTMREPYKSLLCSSFSSYLYCIGVNTKSTNKIDWRKY